MSYQSWFHPDLDLPALVQGLGLGEPRPRNLWVGEDDGGIAAGSNT